MPKRTTHFEKLLPPRDASAPAYRWLYNVLRGEILEGHMRPGARLPGTRELAERYGLARGTIVSAFDQLKSEGYVEGSVGSGTYVSAVLPDELLHVRATPPVNEPAPRQRRRHVSDYARRLQPFLVGERPIRAFRPNLPALDLFPTTLWAQLTSRRWRGATTKLLAGCDALGYQPLREAIAEYLVTSRGVQCSAEQIVVLSGTQEALELVARLFVNPGDRVCIEDPGYPGATIVFEAAGAKLVPMPVDDEGMQIRKRSLTGARLAYITPGHQFPLGVTMSLARRLELLEWARNEDALILEDDYDSEYRYSGRPIPAFQGLDRNGHVLFVGSFSKVLFPSLRLGYLVAPIDLVPHFEAAISVTTRHASLLEQAVLCDFMEAGHFGRHLRRMREAYAERLSVLMDAAKQRLGGLLEISTIEAGLQTVGWLHNGMNGESAAKVAAKRKVEVTPLAHFSRRASVDHGLHLGFAAVDAHEIRRGVRELEIALM